MKKKKKRLEEAKLIKIGKKKASLVLVALNKVNKFLVKLLIMLKGSRVIFTFILKKTNKSEIQTIIL